MGFISFAGRVLFASVFILSAFQQFKEYGVDGGPAAAALRPKYDAFTRCVKLNFGIQLPEIKMKYFVDAAMSLKIIGGVDFIRGNRFGACYLLLHQIVASPILLDLFDNGLDKIDHVQLLKYTESLVAVGALLFFLGMENYSILRRQVNKKKGAPKPKTN